MHEKRNAPERERRNWIIILIILLFGFLCIFLAGGQALRILPGWKLNTSMDSKIDPDSVYDNSRPNNFLEPIDSSVLTPPGWFNVFLTPGAIFNTPVPLINSTPAPTSTVPNTPLATNTHIPTVTPPPTNTPFIVIVNPTNTSIIIPTKTSPPPPKPDADLQITKTDGSATYIAGITVTYTIVVSNPTGTVNVTNATVKDTFPPQVLSATWTCTASAGATCPAIGTGNINHQVNLPVGSSVTYTVNAQIAPSATGDLVNTATVSVPGNVNDPDTTNNSATDTDTLATVGADLSITKTDGPAVTTYTPGNPITYTIVASNAGPDAVTGATVADTFDTTRLKNITWTCAASAGASCTASGAGNISDTVNLPVGATVTYTVNAGINSNATGNLVNTATVSAPSVYDPNTTNNSATDTDTPVLSADLKIEKTDNSTDYVAGALKTYVITVTNLGPSDVTGATVIDIFSTNTNIDQSVPVLWGCLNCVPIIGGTGDINRSVNISSGSSVTFYAIVRVVPASPPLGPPSGPLVNTAMVTAPAGISDPPGNNTATDTDQLVVVNGTVGSSPNGIVTNYLAGSYVTLQFATPLDTSLGQYLVYYPEYPNPPADPTIQMDVVIIQVGDGSNWYTVLNWGNGSPDANTDIPYSLNSVDCTSEADNCPIDIALLTINSPYPGITINVPAGTYPYIRIISPPNPPDSGDDLDVDAIQVLP